MKTIIIFLTLITSTLVVHSQSNDEKKKNLQDYKEMYDKGLIDSAEYSNLKKQMLFGSPVIEQEPLREVALKDYKPQRTIGRVVTTIGLIGLASSVVYWHAGEPKLVGPQTAQSLEVYDDEMNRYSINRTIFVVCSSVDMLVGILILGSANKKIANQRKAKLSLSISPNEVGLALRF